jgi:hypothetical protein
MQICVQFLAMKPLDRAIGGLYDTSVQRFFCGALVGGQGELADVCGEVTREIGMRGRDGFVEGDFRGGAGFG